MGQRRSEVRRAAPTRDTLRTARAEAEIEISSRDGTTWVVRGGGGGSTNLPTPVRISYSDTSSTCNMHMQY